MRDRLTLTSRACMRLFRNVLKCSRERLYYLTSCCSCSGSTPLSYHTGVCLDATKLNISVQRMEARAPSFRFTQVCVSSEEHTHIEWLAREEKSECTFGFGANDCSVKLDWLFWMRAWEGRVYGSRDSILSLADCLPDMAQRQNWNLLTLAHSNKLECIEMTFWLLGIFRTF